MPIGDPYSWLKFLHVLAVLGFLAVHGGSVNVAFKLRGERDPERIRALLDLSNAYLNAMYALLGLLVISGIVAGIAGGWFTKAAWIWLALGLLIAVMAAMYYLGTNRNNAVRKAAGLPYFEGSKPQPAIDPVPEAELGAIAQAARPWELATIGFGGIAVITFLMMFKPF